ncbi:MAG: hypothetical protein WCK89_25530, partial [bacterium]
GGLWLSVPGFLAGFLFLPGIGVAYNRYRVWAYCGDGFMPPCSCGSKTFKVEVMGEKVFHEVCQACGRHYSKRKDKVYVVNGEETLPYMHLVKRRGWIEMDSQAGRGE